MIIKESYDICFRYGEGTYIAVFTCNTINEVKQIMKKLSVEVDGDPYIVKLYKVTWTWDMTNGTVTKTETLVNLDS